jgi:integrase
MTELTSTPAKKPRRRPKAKSRVYWRGTGADRRAWGDFRDVGGKREALVAPGDSRATTDPVIADHLVGERLKELLGAKRDRVFGKKAPVPLGAYVAQHLIDKAKSGKYSASWLTDSERMLTIAIDHFGATRDLTAISVSDVHGYVDVLRARSNGRDGTLGAGAIRHHLNVLSNVFKTAQSLEKVPIGHNPVALLLDKPEGQPEEAKWLHVHEGALLLESARTYVPKRPDAAMPFIYPLMATYLLTGGRETEVLGLEVADVNFDAACITFRPNQWRRLKTKKSHRTIPLWPQLAAILKEYLKTSGRKTGLLFPSPRLTEPGMVTDFRKALDAVAERAGWKEGEIRSKMFRHTYCAARLQTLDHGAPVATFTVSRELGHSNTKLVDEVYGHLPKDGAHRSEVVEYRVAQHRAKLKTHLKLLRSA